MKEDYNERRLKGTIKRSVQESKYFLRSEDAPRENENVDRLRSVGSM